MFFIKCEATEAQLLLGLAAKKGMTAKRVARLALLLGLRSLAKISDVDLEELSVRPRLRKRRKPIEEIQAYIREHWEQESDEEMGKAMDCAATGIGIIRRDLGLLRSKGCSGGTPRAPREPRRPRYDLDKLDALIREHWETKDDWEIGRLMEPVLKGPVVQRRRFDLGLKKERGTKSRTLLGMSIREAINPEEFERMVLREGYYITEYMREKGLTCSRERVRQVAEQMGLKHSPEDRAPEWALVRKARELGNLNLANREWLAEKVRSMVSLQSLAAELETHERDLYTFVRAFEITHPAFRKHGVEVEHLVCGNPKCGKPFTRLKRWTDQRRKNAGDKPLVFYCSVPCVNSVQGSRRTRKATFAASEAA